MGHGSDAHNNRVKVRIPGKQSQGPEVLDQDLPWAIVLNQPLPEMRNGTSTGLSGGEWVIGFYLDENEQLPVIMQVLGKNEVSGAKIKASENGTTQFKDVSRYNSGLVAQAHQITGGPRKNRNGPAVPSKEDFNDALASKRLHQNNQQKLSKMLQIQNHQQNNQQQYQWHLDTPPATYAAQP